MIRRYLHSRAGYVVSIGFGLLLGAIVGGLDDPVRMVAAIGGGMMMLVGMLDLMGGE